MNETKVKRGTTYWCDDPECSRVGMMGNVDEKRADGTVDRVCGGKKVGVKKAALTHFRRTLRTHELEDRRCNRENSPGKKELKELGI